MIKLQEYDCLEYLKTMEDNSVDSLITDPPAGISFMGKDWDKDKGGRDNWIAWMKEVMAECLRVLKPGAHGFVWALPRTSHWTATALENAGFEVRDIVTHIFGSGFPKNHDVSKAIDKLHGAKRNIVGVNPSSRPNSKNKGSRGFDSALGGESAGIQHLTAPSSEDAKTWQGWGSALKPSNEHYILVRKPLEKKLTVAKNVLKYGTGAINIDASRVGTGSSFNSCKIIQSNPNPQGRFPANTIVDESAIDELDLQSGVLKSGGKSGNAYNQNKMGSYTPGSKQESTFYGSSGGASRFFYCPKASRKDKNNGCQELLTWENQDQNLQEKTVELSLLVKDISEDTLLSLEDIEWSTLSFGKGQMDQCQRAIRYTTKIMTRLITDLKTSNASQHWNIKGFIRDVEKERMADGISHVEIVECLKTLKQATTNEKMVSQLDVKLAVLDVKESIIMLAKKGNVHSTVKNTKLMSYLIKMITPPNGIVLDPFIGSGSTGVAAKRDGFGFVGIEAEPEYMAIAKARLEGEP